MRPGETRHFTRVRGRRNDTAEFFLPSPLSSSDGESGLCLAVPRASETLLVRLMNKTPEGGSRLTRRRGTQDKPPFEPGIPRCNISWADHKARASDVIRVGDRAAVLL
ncbi:hypothetical protein E2C01_050078 [Portunus trituberculatus]|uniref:Uncharacterized protein n=1 Tax=Portunus trituberculatus TaxID=210409 RepID=A0A5B7GFJ0_PORTR|nr:hypothetical protein [Portunus trituberculatus]